MFENTRKTKKIVALFLVFTMMLAHTFTVVQYAATSLGKQNSSETNENVNYDAVFVVNDEKKGYDYTADMKEKDLKLKLNVGVEKSGYLKNASIELDAENGLNFEIGEVELNDLIQKIENNKISLNQINVDDNAEVVLPISYKDSDSIDNLSKVTSAKLSGVYVNDLGEENKISETVKLRLTWNTNSELNVSSEITKYIPYNSDNKSGVIVQTLVRMNMSDKAELVGKENLEIKALDLEGLELDKVTVIRNNEAEFTSDDWKYNKEDKTISINLENKESKDFIKEEFLVTYIFDGKKEIELPLKLDSKIKATVEMFGSNEKIEAEKEESYTVSEKVGEIISVKSEITEDLLNKGNMIADKYNKAKEYVTNYEVNHRINVSSTDLVEKISITDIDENFKVADTAYSTVNSSNYKDIKVSKEEFSRILGTDGKISIMSRGEEVASIDSTSKVDEKGNYITSISKEVSRITINTTAPKSEGNINIKADKEIKDTEFGIEDVKKFDSISYESQGSIYLTGDTQNKVSENSDLVKLENTKTDAGITINKKSLSTIANNENVEIKVSLNNDELGTDFYQNPKFEITLPEYITEVDFKNVSIANSGDDFKIENASANVVDGRVVINVQLSGTQTSYPLNKLTDGTNIIINTNMRLNLLTPSKDDTIKMTYTNDIATEYKDEGKDEAKVSYVAPSGVISVNTVSNYAGEDSKVTSVEQGEKTDKIEIFDEAKTATMDILVMNNKDNVVKDVKVLGRIPFKGNKDVKTGADLGTTVDTKLASLIKSNEENKVNVTIYYSENGEATDEIGVASNGWTTDVTDLSKIKSYLIVADGYEMNKADILRFSYDYTIPENLEHNNNIFGSFETLYTNVSELSEKSEVSTPDLVGLTTGKGPNLKVETKVNIDNESVKKYEKVTYTAEITNTGEEAASNVKVETVLPEGTSFVEYQKQGSIYEEKGWKYIEGRENTETFDTIKPGETKKVEFIVEANSVEEDAKNLEWKTDITAKDLAKTLESETITTAIEKADVVVEESTETIADIIEANNELTYVIAVRNTSGRDLSNVKIEKDLPELLRYSDNYVQGLDEELNPIKNRNNCNYDIDTRKVTWTIDNLGDGLTEYVVLEAVAGNLTGDVYQDRITTNSKVTVDSNVYYTGEITELIARPKLVVEQVSNTADNFVSEGEEVSYTIKVKNEGIVQANQVQVTDELPDEVTIKSLKYEIDGNKSSRAVSNNEDAVVYTSIAPDSELVFDVVAVANEISLSQKAVSNIARVESANAGTVSTNAINNIVEQSAKVDSTETVENRSEIAETSSTTTSEGSRAQEVKSVNNNRYKITGTAWFDQNTNGQKDNKDSGVEGIKAVLVDTSTGNRIQTVATSENGEYSFSNLPDGKYYVIFYYNSSRYGLATYKKEGINDNVNSDVINSQIEEDGQTKIVAVTDAITISGGSKSNVNIGLVAASIFDLSLTKTVSSITVQNEQGTKKYDYDNLTLAKVELPAKYAAESKVLVEYKLTIKNEGDVEGYAKKIVDYKPAGMDFSTELNPNWYEGSDGNLYNEELVNTPLAKGQEKTITLVLSREMTETNTGIVNNTAEIAESYNRLGIADRNSTPGNKSQSENDLGRADTIISISTGNTLIYISLIISIITIAIILIIVIRMNKYKIKWYLHKKEVI